MSGSKKKTKPRIKDMEVIEDKKLVGMITESDIFRFVVSQTEKAEDDKAGKGKKKDKKKDKDGANMAQLSQDVVPFANDWFEE